eukprot:CAMPEP_0119546870 /NCGR_PEP_ID=MMETSP1352-20130426/1109_1 /TAXON_ID=265584 /ORGANISM="Stauroneis constricta, Strain CCMP1120" /LENGTH=61 /DNA_ID=CAMNT_0007591613 /DNA_START=1236 /DNA_END=1421 /DNA_ORIENTATION=-
MKLHSSSSLNVVAITVSSLFMGAAGLEDVDDDDDDGLAIREDPCLPVMLPSRYEMPLRMAP